MFGFDTAYLRDANAEATLLPERFRQLGYASVAYGKIHHCFPVAEIGRSYDSGGHYQYESKQGRMHFNRLAAERNGHCPDKDCVMYSESRLPYACNDTKGVRACAKSVIPDTDVRGRRNAHFDELHTDAALAALAGWVAQPPVGRDGNATNFLLMLGLYHPHLPWSAAQRFWDLYPEATVALPHQWNSTPPGLHPWAITLSEFGTYPDIKSYRIADPANFPFNIPQREIVALNRG